MFHWLGYLILAYIALGAIIYIYGHPRAFIGRKTDALENKEDYDRPVLISTAGIAGRYLAHAVQMVNFMTHRAVQTAVKADWRTKYRSLDDLYADALYRAFQDKNFFITTGSPHSRALYLRNFAWFYPTLLDPNSIIDGDDARRRITILIRSLNIIFESMGNKPYTTTLVPLTPKRFAAVNYVKKPSDSLLGILAGIETLLYADAGQYKNLGPSMDQARRQGLDLLNKNKEHLIAQLDHIIESLQTFEHAGVTTLLIDRDDERSSATDTRLEKRRFITNANVWATLNKAVRLDLIDEEVLKNRLGRSLTEYKDELLSVFGENGTIINSLDEQRPAAGNIVLDFAHIYNGFWSFSTPKETTLFKNTVDALINDPSFQDDSGDCFFVSATNPNINKFERFAVASYHGRTAWPAFNVELADRLIDLSQKIGDENYREIAGKILRQIEMYILINDCYPEALGSNGRLYSTWIYRSAKADSWFPRFMSVRAKILKPEI